MTYYCELRMSCVWIELLTNAATVTKEVWCSKRGTVIRTHCRAKVCDRGKEKLLLKSSFQMISNGQNNKLWCSRYSSTQRTSVCKQEDKILWSWRIQIVKQLHNICCSVFLLLSFNLWKLSILDVKNIKNIFKLRSQEALNGRAVTSSSN